jgi:hypothetical protein
MGGPWQLSNKSALQPSSRFIITQVGCWGPDAEVTFVDFIK